MASRPRRRNPSARTPADSDSSSEAPDAPLTTPAGAADASATDSSGKKGTPTIKIHPEVFNGSSIVEVDGLRLDLKNRMFAAFLAWLIPGAGHYYQGRQTKAMLFLICILSIWFLGFALGGGHVVYASFVPGDRRWHYALQAGVGAAALPALVQGNRMRLATDPRTGRSDPNFKPLWRGFMSPPRRPVMEGEPDEVAAWYARSGSGYELGTWYTMIAGLLNIFVIYDAFGGPLSVHISGRRDPKG